MFSFWPKNRWQYNLFFNGWAIVYKSRKFKSEWSEHIFKTKEFLRGALTGGEELHVFGAGRLIDFPLREISERYKEIHLYDGDPGAIKYLNSLSDKKIIVHSVELSGGLAKFNSTLSRFREIKNIFSNSEFNWLVQENALPPINLRSNCHLVSLNLVSQLPLAYREILERWIVKSYGKKYLSDNELSWLHEYNLLGANIVLSHFKFLAASNALKIVLICDTEQLFFPNSITCLPEPNPEPFSWEVAATNQALEITSSICGIDLFADIKKRFPEFSIVNKDFWPWHLIPASKTKNGVLCRVDAIDLLRRGSKN